MRTLTPLQIEASRKHQERLQRIAAAAINAPLSQPAPEAEIVALPATEEPEPTPPAAIRVMWFDDDDRISVEKIKRVVAENYGVTRIDLESQRRHPKVTFPRQIAYYLSKKLTTNSLPAIAKRFGDRDHTSVYHGIRKIERMMAADQELAVRVAAISESITGSNGHGSE